MAKLGYSITKYDMRRSAKAMGREMRISPKHAREVCAAIRGMKLDDVKHLLEQVIQGKRFIPMRRYNSGVGHRRGAKGFPAGRYPRKVCKYILRVLANAEANAEYKGLNTDRLWVKHIAAHRGPVIPGWIPRASGRATPFNTPTTHVEVLVEER